MNDGQKKALALLSHSGKGMTELANVIISKNVSYLLIEGYVRYAKNRNGYALTKKGKAAL